MERLHDDSVWPMNQWDVIAVLGMFALFLPPIMTGILVTAVLIRRPWRTE